MKYKNGYHDREEFDQLGSEHLLTYCPCCGFESQGCLENYVITVVKKDDVMVVCHYEDLSEEAKEQIELYIKEVLE